MALGVRRGGEQSTEGALAFLPLALVEATVCPRPLCQALM